MFPSPVNPLDNVRLGLHNLRPAKPDASHVLWLGGLFRKCSCLCNSRQAAKPGLFSLPVGDHVWLISSVFDSEDQKFYRLLLGKLLHLEDFNRLVIKKQIL